MTVSSCSQLLLLHFLLPLRSPLHTPTHPFSFLSHKIIFPSKIHLPRRRRRKISQSRAEAADRLLDSRGRCSAIHQIVIKYQTNIDKLHTLRLLLHIILFWDNLRPKIPCSPRHLIRVIKSTWRNWRRSVHICTLHGDYYDYIDPWIFLSLANQLAVNYIIPRFRNSIFSHSQSNKSSYLVPICPHLEQQEDVKSAGTQSVGQTLLVSNHPVLIFAKFTPHTPRTLNNKIAATETCRLV